MQYPPKTDQEIEAEFLLSPGQYDGYVMEAEERDDKKGRPFYMLKFCFFDKEGKEHHVYDNISPSWFHQRFKHFFASAGKLELYGAGTNTAEQLQGLNITAIVDQQQDKDYPMRNVITDYVVVERSPQAVKAEADDSLPF